MIRHCKNKCRIYGELVRLYQDGPISPTGMISWRCPICGLLDFEFCSQIEKDDKESRGKGDKGG